MEIEEKVFLYKRPDFSKFAAFGFKETAEGYVWEAPFMEGEFLAQIQVDREGKLRGNVMDAVSLEPFLPFRAKGQNGGFICAVRSAYEDLLQDLACHCYYDVYFPGEQANRITELIRQTYQDVPDFPWKEKVYQHSGVFRHKDSGKWYGLMMQVRKSVFFPKDENGEEMVDAMNLKILETEGEALWQEDGIFPAYHMNHKLWISVVLDDRISDQRVMELVAHSYELTDKRKKRGKE